MAGMPFRDQIVELVCTVESTKVGENISVEIVLPKEVPPKFNGIEFIGGQLRWLGPVPEDGKIEIRAKVKPISDGIWIITAWAGTAKEPRLNYDLLFVSVACDRFEISNTPFRTHLTYTGYSYDYRCAIVLSDNNTNYREIVLSFPGIKYEDEWPEKSALIVISNPYFLNEQIRQFDFVKYADILGGITYLTLQSEGISTSDFWKLMGICFAALILIGALITVPIVMWRCKKKVNP